MYKCNRKGCTKTAMFKSSLTCLRCERDVEPSNFDAATSVDLSIVIDSSPVFDRDSSSYDGGGGDSGGGGSGGDW